MRFRQQKARLGVPQSAGLVRFYLILEILVNFGTFWNLFFFFDLGGSVILEYFNEV